MGQTVNLLAQPSKVRILHSPMSGVVNATPLFYLLPMQTILKKSGWWRIRTVKHADQREEEVPWYTQPNRKAVKVPLLMAPKELDRGSTVKVEDF